MRTASEIINSNNRLKKLSSCTRGNIAIVINEARKETIEECAKRAKAVLIPSNPFQDRYSAISNQQGFSVDKQSILSLINKLK